LTERLKAEARRLGFDALGIAPAVAPPGYGQFREWLRLGHAAGMSYLERQAEARAHPQFVLEGVRSIIVGLIVYRGHDEDEPPPEHGKIARYARGGDYHELFWRRLEALLAWLQGERPGVRGRAVADTAPLLERDFARLAGLGWIGRNTMLINRRLGSYTLLGALLVDLDLDYDPPHETSHCGTCTRCLEACPTEAFPAPYHLDARQCISYWTIEHRGPIPDSMADQLEGWAFGCDICQEVCPWNRKAPEGTEPMLAPQPEWASADLRGWLAADPEAFRKALKGTALSRAKRAGLIRNAALVLGQRRDSTAVPELIQGLLDDEPVVRDACAWALERIGTEAALRALEGNTGKWKSEKCVHDFPDAQ
jgi:epoxyqueuosine reductase